MKALIFKLILALVFIPQILSCQTEKKTTLYVASFNVENLFDAVDDPEKDDAEFLPESEKFWTDGKINVKLNNLAKVINYMNNGVGPDVLAIQEVENFNMMKLLCYALKDREYIPAHRESKDPRGIDVGLLYDRKLFEIEDLKAIEIVLPNGFPTRDILHVTLKHKTSGEVFHFFVNHWPSRRGGKEKSDINRQAAAKILKSLLNELSDKTPEANVIILGDFNDSPFDPSISKVLSALDFECQPNLVKKELLNLAYKKADQKDGSYLFARNWEMIDQIIASPNFIDAKRWEYECNSYEIIKPEFMIIPSGDRKGGALPTYMGTKYIGGFSDHFPVGARFYYKDEN
ncbi:MAG: endonuclease/exonuclease/phosphatase family [Ignavibacteria bacterium]|nr:MAG: endonuclease/exonuclease/phosphatase family [Ignavibacteria bacterium]KAF0162121.1 MAG: endonuclease/exonuclease/phosphatase family [Ignavibacteria bacterium]